MAFSTCACLQISPLWKDTSQTGAEPTVMTSFKLEYIAFLQVKLQSEVLGVRVSAYEYGWGGGHSSAQSGRWISALLQTWNCSKKVVVEPGIGPSLVGSQPCARSATQPSRSVHAQICRMEILSAAVWSVRFYLKLMLPLNSFILMALCPVVNQSTSREAFMFV